MRERGCREGTSEDAALLRIAQESIANAVRHARASRIDVTVSYLPDHVTLDVVDDGCGFDQYLRSVE